MWNALKQRFETTFAIRLHQLTIKFETYIKLQHHLMKQHLRDMSNMICELNIAGHVQSDEQQIQAVIRLLPQN
ncbi:hypothetical protein Syun_006614 [Stephania yunnanensis]|uniref:Uncharacterized protein n=1 Tax=Stephania yunnanensis TaxID=152371 RepID=A0AAP0KWY1_9MAGN